MISNHRGMTDAPLIDQALAKLVAAQHAYRVVEDRVSAELAEARRLRDHAIADAARDGVRQNMIIKTTGYSRETIRQIVRDAEASASGPADEEPELSTMEDAA